jgi:long-chain acyl-CoA synthetase
MSNLWDVRAAPTDNRIMVDGDTLVSIFWNAIALRGKNVWMRQKAFGIWQAWTHEQTGQAVTEIGNGLLSLGFQAGEVASILSNTVIEWVLCDFAIMSCGGLCSGIYPTDAAAQVHYLCADSRTSIVFVEDEEQLDKALTVRDQLPLLRKIIVFDTKGLRHFHDPQVMSLDALRQLGREHLARNPDELVRRAQAVSPADLALLVYTSGTTGRPKGVLHDHRSMVFSVRNLIRVLPQDESDERMCFLPLCHVAERLLGTYCGIYSGTRLSFVENPATVPQNVREIAPTMLFAVPRVWEKFYSNVTISVQEAARLQRWLYEWGIAVGQQVAEQWLAAQPIGSLLRWRFRLARFLVLNNVRKSIGINRCRYISTSAAPISPTLIKWYFSLGVPMWEGWGQTESGGTATVTRPGHIRLGTVGKPVDGMEVKLDPASGELLIRGPSLTVGYLNLPDKTAETIDRDGWLHTGDVGVIDADGFVRITDRLKDIIITAGGKNVTPSEIENELKFSPYITDAVVIGDRRPYLVAIVMIEQDTVETFAQGHDIPFSNYASLTRAPEVRSLIQDEIEKVNRKFARVEQIKQFFLLDTQLSAEDEELTPTMKLKRKLVEKKYALQIDALYQDEKD